MKRSKHFRQGGQGMTEYIIIVALIALAGIAAFALFGDVIRGQTGVMAATIGGADADEAREAVIDARDDAIDEAGQQYGLDDYESSGERVRGR